MSTPRDNEHSLAHSDAPPASPTVPPAISAQPTGTKRLRASGQTIEQSRRERVNRLMYERVQVDRRSIRHERRRRGVVMDAWIKCGVLPDGWDSEEDESGHWGGVDNLSTPLHPGNNEKGEAVDAGDVGDYAKRIARGFRKLGRVWGSTSAPPLPKKRKLAKSPPSRREGRS